MWSRLDDGLLDHRKIFKAGQCIGRNGPGMAIGMYAIGLMWTNKHLTDGHLPVEVVEKFGHFHRPLDMADALVKAGLWERVDDGYQIHDFHQINPAATKVKANREWDRRRKDLLSDSDLLERVRSRDENRCRYCGDPVDWHNRRGPRGGQYDHVQPRGANSDDNIVVACQRCNNMKGNRTPEEANMPLLPPPGKKGNGAT